MSSAPQIGPIPQQYAAAATVPLIKSPSLWLPLPVEMPNDIHPLPEDITAYFVYPFTLEQHIASLNPSPQFEISDRRARLAAVLHAREVQEEQREKAELHRKAPGYNPHSLLQPISAHPTQGSVFDSFAATSSASRAQPDVVKERDPMDDLVAKLEEMESSK